MSPYDYCLPMRSKSRASNGLMSNARSYLLAQLVNFDEDFFFDDFFPFVAYSTALWAIGMIIIALAVHDLFAAIDEVSGIVRPRPATQSFPLSPRA